MTHKCKKNVKPVGHPKLPHVTPTMIHLFLFVFFVVTPAKIQLYTRAVHVLPYLVREGLPTVSVAHADAAAKIVVLAELGGDLQVREFYI